MTSLLPGFEHDIFVSHRPEDNRGGRWVTEFVNALKVKGDRKLLEDESDRSERWSSFSNPRE
jgi:hypothetical protein